MAPPKKAVKPVAAKKITKPASGKNLKYLFIVCAVIVTIVAYHEIFSGDLQTKHNFVSWDDPVYVLFNPNFSHFNAKEIFSSFYTANYHPFTMISLNMDYKIGGYDPRVFLVHNLLLHLLSVILIFFIIRKLFKNDWMAFFVCLLFGVHPMHVESVAWVSERKDVLHTAWYFGALLAYLVYAEGKRKEVYWVSLALFLGALFSKGQAVTLSLVLVLYDWYKQRGWSSKVILEKVPFFILSLIFGLIAVKAQKTGGGEMLGKPEAWQSILVGFYGLVRYTYMFIVPYPLSCLHPYTFKAGESLPLIMYLSPLIVLLAAGLIYFFLRKRREAVFGIAFFILTIFPVLQFFPVGQQMIAERYSYIPYTGLAIFLLAGLQLLFQSKNNNLYILTGIFAICLTFMTTERVKIWRSTDNLWGDVLEKYHNTAIPYINRGFWNNQEKKYNEGLADADAGLKLEQNNYKLWGIRGVANENLGNYKEAVSDYTNSLKYNDTSNAIAYSSRGIIYTDRFQEFDKGIEDFKRALMINPNNYTVQANLGVAYYKKREFKEAYDALEKASALNPAESKIYYLMSLCKQELGERDQAAQLMKKATDLGYGK